MAQGSAPSIPPVPLDGDIRCLGIPLQIRFQLLQELWGPLITCKQSEIPCDAYFKYYAEQSSQALNDRGRHTSARTHGDIVEVARLLKQPISREAVLQYLRDRYKIKNQPVDEKALNGSINLAARLLLMIEVGTVEFGFSGQTRLLWTTGTLQNCVEDHFGSAPTLKDPVKLERLFKARNLVRIAGLQIVWTDNLADHLRLIDDDQKVTIFHYASFLKHHATSLLPDALSEETLRSLALLFPQSDAESRKWLRNICQAKQLDSGLLRCGSLKADSRQIERFYYWRDRLVVLKQVFDDAEPKTLSQWWYDRRKNVQWFTFWLAVLILILTIFFGLIQSIEGALQVYKAFVPTK